MGILDPRAKGLSVIIPHIHLAAEELFHGIDSSQIFQ